jgi:hypothetical protein
VAADYEQSVEQYNQFREHMTNTLDRLTAYLDHTIKQNKPPADGKDTFGMTFHDYNAVPMSAHDHKQYIAQLEQARQQLTTARRQFDNQDPDQTDMQSTMEAAAQVMDSINQRLDKKAS